MLLFKCPPGCEDRTWFVPPAGADVGLWAWYRVLCKGTVRYTQSWVYWNQEVLNFVAETEWDENMRRACVECGVRVLDHQSFSSHQPVLVAGSSLKRLQQHDEELRAKFFAARGAHPSSGFVNPTPDEAFETPLAWEAMDDAARLEWVTDQLLCTNLVSHSDDNIAAWVQANAARLVEYAKLLPIEAVGQLARCGGRAFGAVGPERRRQPASKRPNWRAVLRPGVARSARCCVNRTGIPEFTVPTGASDAEAATWTFLAVITLGASYGNDDLSWVDDNFEWIKRVAGEHWDQRMIYGVCGSNCVHLWPMLAAFADAQSYNETVARGTMGRLNSAYVYRNAQAVAENHVAEQKS